MDKQTFYAELSKRLLNLGLSQEYIDRHLAQFDSYFKGKNDDDVVKEIAKLGDLDKVAARIKRMTEKAISDAKEENEARKREEASESVIVNRDEVEINAEPESKVSVDCDDDVVVFNKSVKPEIESDELVEAAPETHGTKRGEIIESDENTSVTSAPIDPEIIEQNRKKFWIIFAATLPITLSILAATAFGFGFLFFCVAIVILISIGTLIFVTAAGTLVSVFGIIFGVSQMLNSMPVGLYECGVAIMIGAFALAIGILVYNFAVRFMPIVAKWLIKLVHFVIRKYRELYVNLKKECIGL